MKRFGSVAFAVLIVGFGWLSFFNSTGGNVSLFPKAANAASQVLTDTIEIQIVGGGPASAEEYPWMAALVSAASPNAKNGQFCGGALIDREWVLTAAHCVEGETAATIDVVVGVNDLDNAGSSSQRLDVAQIIPYPFYSNNTENGDVALLKLSSLATINTAVQTITLVTADTLAKTDPGTTATVTGWGVTSEGGSSPETLYEVNVPIISNAVCNSTYGGITAGMLCAGFAAGGKDSCQGDSGGPLVVSDGAGGWLQAGVVSWGIGCAQPGYYGVYARVSQYASWILSETGITYGGGDGNGGGGGGPLDNFVYLPLVLRASGNNGNECITENGDVANDINQSPPQVFSGQKLCGQVSSSDIDDVYKIYATTDQQFILNLTGNGGDADLYLFAPGTSAVNSGWYAVSAGINSTESIQITIPQSGYWYVDVYCYDGTINYELTVTQLP